MLKWFLGTLLGTVLGVAGYFTWYLGAFKPVLIAEKNQGPFHLLYKEHTGAYHKIAPTIAEVETWAKSKGLDCSRTFGEYFDDPRSVDEGRLHSRGGCLLNELPSNLQNELSLSEYKTSDLPEKKYVTAVFEGSPGIGPMKVYPKVEEYFSAKGQKPSGAVMEIYVVHSEKAMTTTYLFPL